MKPAPCRSFPSVTSWARAALFFLSLAAVHSALAGVFSVTPVRIYMTPRDRAVAVTITNDGDSPVVLQADLHQWTQTPEGNDELVLTEDLILSPPIIKLASKARQVVRLARLKPADASRQLIYRLILRELPEVTAPKGNTVQVAIALALSMPVFITPPPAKPDIACGASRADAQSIAVSCANSGSAYAQVREVLVKQGAQVVARFEGGAYILPGARVAISVKSERAVPGGALQLTVTFDDGKTQVFDVTVM
jgi:fimbrial chaperone protein